MTTLEENKDMAETAEKVLVYIGNPTQLRTAMLAAFRLFYSVGYRHGYGDAMADVVKGKDQRIAVHLN